MIFPDRSMLHHDLNILTAFYFCGSVALSLGHVKYCFLL